MSVEETDSVLSIEPVARFEQMTGITLWHKTGALDDLIETPDFISPESRRRIAANSDRFSTWKRETGQEINLMMNNIPLDYSPVLTRILGSTADLDVRISTEDIPAVVAAAKRQSAKFEVVPSATNPALTVYRFAVGSIPPYPSQTSVNRAFLEILPVEGDWDITKCSLERALVKRHGDKSEYRNVPKVRDGQLVCEVPEISQPEDTKGRCGLLFARCKSVAYCCFYDAILSGFDEKAVPFDEFLNIKASVEEALSCSDIEAVVSIQMLQRALGEIHKTIENFPEVAVDSYGRLGILNEVQVQSLKQMYAEKGVIKFENFLETIVGKETFIALIDQSQKLKSSGIDGLDRIDFYAFEFWARHLGVNLQDRFDKP